jgi:hypothetical protein
MQVQVKSAEFLSFDGINFMTPSQKMEQEKSPVGTRIDNEILKSFVYLRDSLHLPKVFCSRSNLRHLNPLSQFLYLFKSL